jgi:transcriptional regulator with XRE-family HTH domain
MTQEVLARRAGITQGHLSKIESGERPNPSVTTLKRLARALDVSVATLLSAD